MINPINNGDLGVVAREKINSIIFENNRIIGVIELLEEGQKQRVIEIETGINKVIVPHDYKKRPCVKLINENGVEVFASVSYQFDEAVIVSWNGEFKGLLIIN